MEGEKTDATVTATTDQGTGCEWVCLRVRSTACTVAMKCCSSDRMDTPPLAQWPSITEEDDAQCWLALDVAETAHLLMASPSGVKLVLSLNFCFFADIRDRWTRLH